jgi:hypothetical protein
MNDLTMYRANNYIPDNHSITDPKNPVAILITKGDNIMRQLINNYLTAWCKYQKTNGIKI